MRPSQRSAAKRSRLARRAEDMAAAYLQSGGFEVIGRNVLAGGGELDVIAVRGGLVVFCEVRGRRSDDLVSPLDTLDAKKTRRVRQAAMAWLASQRRNWSEIRFDAAGVVFDSPEGRMTYLEGAF